MTTLATLTRRLPQHSDDTGSISLLFAVIGATLLLMTGFIADGASRAQTLHRVTTAANEAARAAGQQIAPGNTIRGVAPQLNPSAAAAAANAYLAAAGVEGTVTVSGRSITVTTHIQWTPQFIGIIGVPSSDLTGSAHANLARGLTTEEPR